MCGPLPDPVPWFPLVMEIVGVPPDVSTVTNSFHLILTDRVNPSDLSAVVVIHSTSPMSAAPTAVARSPTQHRTSG